MVMHHRKDKNRSKQFRSKLNEITTGNPKNKSEDQLDTIKNIKNLYNSRKKRSREQA